MVEPARMLWANLERLNRHPDADLLFRAYALHARAVAAYFTDDTIGEALQALREERALCDEAGDVLQRCDAMQLYGMMLGEIRSPEGIAVLHEVLDLTGARGVGAVHAMAQWFLAHSHVQNGAVKEARVAIAAARGRHSLFIDSMIQFSDASIALIEGDFATVRTLAESLVDPSNPFLAPRAGAFAVLGRIDLHEGDAATALVRMRDAFASTAVAMCTPVMRSWLHCVLVEALHALGHEDEHRDALRAALDRIDRIAGGLDEPHRGCWLDRVEPNRRIQAFAVPTVAR